MRPVALVVEDEPDLLHILTLALERALPEVDVRVASTLAQGRGVLKDVGERGGTVVLGLVDHKIAGEPETGLVLLAQVRTQWPQSARFLFTGQASHDVEEAAHALGAKVLWKPLRLAALVAEVQTALPR